MESTLGGRRTPDSTPPQRYFEVDPQSRPDRSHVSEERLPPSVLDELLFSSQHLKLILAHQALGTKFRTFIAACRPGSVSVLDRYYRLTKALRSILYAESIIRGLETEDTPMADHIGNVAIPWVIREQADRQLSKLASDDLRAFIADLYIRSSHDALSDQILRKQSPESPALTAGLAEAFVVSDPARPDNPIIFTSDEFHNMTGFPREEFLGRNCRILGGPHTSRTAIRRFHEALALESSHCEVLLN